MADKSGALARARALYDHVLARMKYDKSGEGWGRGDALYACDARAGNCTDFHAYFIALARAVGIPARFAIGVTIPADHDEGSIAGYHCWAEFCAEGKWVPVDISEASKNPALADYYFGHHPANRFELTRGRDLLVDPAPASGPINFLVYPLLEVGGKPVKAETEFAFHRTSPVKHLILATAGHVDHGKSALVRRSRARIPIGCRRKKRAASPSTSALRSCACASSHLGLIDVPGHEDFVKNMVAGVGAVDVALLVVAADDGWMPQTEEHLQILTYLGVTHAVVALTKADLAGDRAAAIAAVRERLENTPLSDAPIVATAISDPASIAALRAALARSLRSRPTAAGRRKSRGSPLIARSACTAWAPSSPAR